MKVSIQKGPQDVFKMIQDFLYSWGAREECQKRTPQKALAEHPGHAPWSPKGEFVADVKE